MKKCSNDKLEKSVISKKAFQLAEHETTVEAFEIFIENTGYITDAEKNIGEFLACNDYPKDIQDTVGSSKNWRSPGFAQSANHPVVCVSYRDVEAYINWLNTKNGKNYRLPTSEEWLSVYGKKTTKNCTDGGIGLVYDLCPGTYGTFEVKHFAANEFKLFDMNGNVQEWVQTCRDNCKTHLIYGDSIKLEPTQFDPCKDYSKNNDFRSSDLGFRLAIDTFDNPQ